MFVNTLFKHNKYKVELTARRQLGKILNNYPLITDNENMARGFGIQKKYLQQNSRILLLQIIWFDREFELFVSHTILDKKI